MKTGEFTIKTTYLGKDLAEAYQNCMSDEKVYDDWVKSWEILSARRLTTHCKVGYSDELMEVWEFECFLHNV